MNKSALWVLLAGMLVSGISCTSQKTTQATFPPGICVDLTIEDSFRSDIDFLGENYRVKTYQWTATLYNSGTSPVYFEGIHSDSAFETAIGIDFLDGQNQLISPLDLSFSLDGLTRKILKATYKPLNECTNPVTIRRYQILQSDSSDYRKLKTFCFLDSTGLMHENDLVVFSLEPNQTANAMGHTHMDVKHVPLINSFKPTVFYYTKQDLVKDLEANKDISSIRWE